MKILINKGLVINAKSYPYWEEFLNLIKDYEVKVIDKKLPLKEIIELVNWCDIWISIDTFLSHLCAYHKLKSGIVLWGKSDPKLFGYEHNINLLKDINYLKPQQFKWWRDEPIDKYVFVNPETIKDVLDKTLKG